MANAKTQKKSPSHLQVLLQGSKTRTWKEHIEIKESECGEMAVN